MYTTIPSHASINHHSYHYIAGFHETIWRICTWPFDIHIDSQRPPEPLLVLKIALFLGIVENPGWRLECLPFYGNVTAPLSCYTASLSHITQVIANNKKPTFFFIVFSPNYVPCTIIPARNWICGEVENMISISSSFPFWQISIPSSWPEFLHSVSDVILQVCRISSELGNFRHQH